MNEALMSGDHARCSAASRQAIPDVRVVGFATPACADVGVSRLCEGLCTSVVLHDDVVPRVTPHAVRALLKDLLCTKVICLQLSKVRLIDCRRRAAPRDHKLSPPGLSSCIAAFYLADGPPTRRARQTSRCLLEVEY